MPIRVRRQRERWTVQSAVESAVAWLHDYVRQDHTEIAELPAVAYGHYVLARAKSDDLDGLREVRDQVTPDVTAGEYGYDLVYFARMVDSQAVDCLQADVTRCGGVTGFLQVAALCQAHNIPLSGHTAPALHTHVACAATPFKNLEYFHDHVRIEQMLFDGLPQLVNGALRPDLSRPGLGLEFNRRDAERFAA